MLIFLLCVCVTCDDEALSDLLRFGIANDFNVFKSNETNVRYVKHTNERILFKNLEQQFYFSFGLFFPFLMLFSLYLLSFFLLLVHSSCNRFSIAGVIMP